MRSRNGLSDARRAPRMGHIRWLNRGAPYTDAKSRRMGVASSQFMNQLRDSVNELVGWLDSGRHIFDTTMCWVAFVSSGHAWSASTGNWLGPVNELTCLDQSGYVVAWNPSQMPAGSPRPPRPPRAPRAPRPPRPGRPPRPRQAPLPPMPVGGWSSLSFEAWLAQ